MIRTIALVSIAFLATASTQVMAQTAEPPATSASQPLTAEEVKAIKRRLEAIEREIGKEYAAYLDAQSAKMNWRPMSEGGQTLDGRSDALSGREPRAPRNAKPVSGRHEQLIAERTTLEAKLTAARIR